MSYVLSLRRLFNYAFSDLFVFVLRVGKGKALGQAERIRLSPSLMLMLYWVIALAALVLLYMRESYSLLTTIHSGKMVSLSTLLGKAYGRNCKVFLMCGTLVQVRSSV